MQEVSTITGKGQTTVPAAVRRALGVRPGDRIAYELKGASVTLHRLQAVGEDPVVTAFLSFLESDMQANPERLRSFPPELLDRMASLTEGNAVDLEAPIDGKVAL